MLYQQVIVPLDLSYETEAAIGYGAAVASQAGAALKLLTVAPSDLTSGTVRHRLEVTAERHGHLATIQVADPGNVAQTLLDEADAPDTLLCLRTHARRPFGELTLGSISEQVVRNCRHPLLLVGPRCGMAPPRIRTMVAAVDGSDLAEAMLPTVASWSTHLGVTPWLLQVLPHQAPLPSLAPDTYESAYVHHLADRLAAEHDVKAEWETIHHRSPAKAIAGFAATLEPSVIALTTHGRSGYSHLVMGSVALDVAHRATVPVLASPPTPGP